MTLPEGTTEHSAAGAAQRPARVAITVVSDKRTLATDESGPLARRMLEQAGHVVTAFALIPNDEQGTYTRLARPEARGHGDRPSI